MLTISGPKNRFCDGVSRRDFLKAGALAFGATSLTWADVLRARAEGPSSRPKAVIMICLPGGPSHLETYDMKPDVSDEFRSEFHPVQTNVPGFDICEHMPQQTRIADKLAVVRNMRFQQPDHQLHEVFTGFPRLDGRPAFGSVVSRLRQDRQTLLPRYISLSYSDHPRTLGVAEIPTYAGPAHRPFEPDVQFLSNLQSATMSELSDRRRLLHRFDNIRRDLDTDGRMDAMDHFSAQALNMLTSPDVRDAFDLSQEPQHVHDLYGADRRSQYNYQFGHTWHGSRFLLARRLVERGVPVVTLGEMGWDHHGALREIRGHIFDRSREQLPWLDQSIYALVTDLHARGLDRDVAVVVWGEFGRTPRINRYTGRDHWVRSGFALFAGGGFRTGQVIGETTARGEEPRHQAYTPQNVFATLYRHLGIDPTTTIPDFTGRPRFLLEDHQVIRELL